ncbi:MAG TPA: FAD/NAD(P)-binding oxidoreductase [Burkholderiales bacterium]|nr:FAD/NAD(P)-binding oxidoreductase [Burkholderiales bacterium]
MKTQTTVILGGGFGGIAAANTLRRLAPQDHAIVLVDRTPRFHVGAGKTWMMLGERTFEQISQARTALLAAGVRFLQADVTGIDLADRSVSAGNERLRWDYLVIALGADVNEAGVPGLAEAAHTFYTVEGAERLRPVLEHFAGGDIAILIAKTPFKCPPAPYEAAMLLHHTFARRGLGDKTRIGIYTVEGAPMATAGPEMGNAIKAELAQRSIAFHPQRKAVRVDGAARRIAFEDGTEAGYDLLISVPPHEAPKLVRDAGLVNASGWIPVDPQTLEVKSADIGGRVYAAGDVTVVPLPGRYKPDMPLVLPKAGVFAQAHGEVIAQQIVARLAGTAPGATFDGIGYCYLETGGGRAVKADGSFFELPNPVMRKQPPDEAQLRDKLDWVARQLIPVA